MANPSDASYRTRCAKFYKRVCDHAAAGVKVPRDEVLSLRLESRKLDEVFAYLIGRSSPVETVKQWRERSSQLTLTER